KIPENFNYPYISKSVTEFWRRWHISLSTWFKRYLYIPLGGNRISKARTAVNLMIVFLVTGFWHGASWNFILWGFWHGCFIVIEKLSGLNTEKTGILRNILLRGYALLAVLIGWVMFRADTLTAAAEYLKKMFGLIPDKYAALDLVYYVDGQELLAFAFAALLSTPAARHFFDVSGKSVRPPFRSLCWLCFCFHRQ
ncbi:MAG: MBOAT family O-acyltransferase, partial [Alphaproteobacteria bacterium]